jgi:putative SOS response-associated peptidase YedK
MCGRYSLTNPQNIAPRFHAAPEDAQLKPRYNVAPTQVMPVVVRAGAMNRIEAMQWGLIPFWSKEPKAGFSNAKAETLSEKPSFKRAFLHRRCVVPASSFYEWQQQGTSKQPHLVHLKGETLFGFAAVWDAWRAADGTAVHSYAIITCPPNSLMAPIHDRMPAILQRADEDVWLDPSLTDPAFLSGLLKPFPASRMAAYRVSTEVNSPRHDTPQLIEPLDHKPTDRYFPSLS